jgi:hypothetical protein
MLRGSRRRILGMNPRAERYRPELSILGMSENGNRKVGIMGVLTSPSRYIYGGDDNYQASSFKFHRGGSEGTASQLGI